MTNVGFEVFSQTDGVDAFVGVDSDADGVLDFVIQLTGVSGVAYSSFAF